MLPGKHLYQRQPKCVLKCSSLQFSCQTIAQLRHKQLRMPHTHDNIDMAFEAEKALPENLSYTRGPSLTPHTSQGCQELSIFLYLQELETDEVFTIEHDSNENTYCLIISQISTRESGCYMCYAENSEGSDSTIGFITVKGQSPIWSYLV